MELKAYLVVFGTVFLAELGDKTQLATLLFASDTKLNPIAVFLAASFALVLSSGLAVVAGASISSYLEPRYLSIAAGVGFISIGIWTLVQVA